MAERIIKKFVLQNGIPELTEAYWSYSEMPLLTNETQGSVLPFYGPANEKNKRDLYCHFRVKDLFFLSATYATGIVPKVHLNDEGELQRWIYKAKKDSTTGTALPATQFVLDLFTFKPGDKQKMFTKDLEESQKTVESRVTDFADLTIDIEPLGKVVFDENYNGQYPEGEVNPDKVVDGNPKFVLQFAGKSLTRYIQLKIKRIISSFNKPLWDICFKLELTDEFENLFIEKGDEHEAIFAWSWVVNWSTWNQYKNIFGIDITKKEDRLSHLKKPHENVITKKKYAPIVRIPGFAANAFRNVRKVEEMVINLYNESPFVKEGKAFEGTLLGDVAASREEYEKAYGSNDITLPDPFPFDEPFQNFIVFRRELPISNIYLGVDIAYPIGICEPVGKDLQWFNSFSFLNKENYGEHFAWLDKFLLQGGTADCWLKSIEQNNVQNANFSEYCNKPIVRKDFPFDPIVQVPFRCIDLMIAGIKGEYKDIIKTGLFCPVPVEKISYLWILEDEALECFQLKDDGAEEKTDSVKGMLYKGFHVDDKKYRFTGVCHNKVQVRGRKGYWQAHSVCQRPLYLMVNVVRDLSEDEMKRYNANPMVLHFQARDTEIGKTFLFNKPLKLEHTLKTGVHLFVLYPQFAGDLSDETVYSCTISAPATLIPIHNNFTDNPDCRTISKGMPTIYRARNWDRFLAFKMAQIKEHSSFTPVEHGLFKDNPLLLVDDVRPAEAIADARKKAVQEFYKDIELGMGSFVASYAFADSDVGDLYDLFRKGEAGEKQATALKAIKALLTSSKMIGSEIIEKWIVRIGIKETVINRVLVVGVFLEKIREAAKTFDAKIKNIEHPFMDTVDFGLSPDHFDSMYMLAATEIKRILDTKTGKYAVSHDKSKHLGVTLLNRFIDIGQGAPFNFQMDKNSGFVERPVNLANEPDSVSIYRIGFQKNIVKMVQAIRNVQSAAGNKMGNYYDALMNGNAFDQIFSKTGNNLNPQFQFSADKEKALLKKAFSSPQSLSVDEIAGAISILKFLNYVDASFATCPKCGAIMKPSWGWCPYHGTREKIDLEDTNFDSNFAKEFFDKYGDYTLKMLRTENLAVHWTEFII
ncbi:MAG: hypothetical protein JW915_11495 [Chitinispirillaceae bacterium]|nr:hypothetical protein [Chitinispirillaceae bacterium]